MAQYFTFSLLKMRRERSLLRVLSSLTSGVPSKCLEDEGVLEALKGSDYVDAYVRLQRARARCLLGEADGTSLPSSLTTRQIMEALWVPSEMQNEAIALPIKDSGLLALLSECWGADALQALRRLDILAILLPTLLLPVAIVLFLQVHESVIEHGPQALATTHVLLPIFGFLGAALSLLMDKTKSHRVVHWAAVWLKHNQLRLVGGVVVGFALAYFEPLLLPAPIAIEVGDAGNELTFNIASNLDEDRRLPTLYLLALTFGFSQDVFMARLQGAATDRKNG